MTHQRNEAALVIRRLRIRVDLPIEVTGQGGISSRMVEPLQPASGLLLTCFETRYDQALGRLH